MVTSPFQFPHLQMSIIRLVMVVRGTEQFLILGCSLDTQYSLVTSMCFNENYSTILNKV